MLMPRIVDRIEGGEKPREVDGIGKRSRIWIFLDGMKTKIGFV